MLKSNCVPMLLASCLLVAGGAGVSAQDLNRDRDQNRERDDDRGWRGRDRDDDRGWRGRDRDDDRGWRGRRDDDERERGARRWDRDDDERRGRGRDRDDDRDRRGRGGERWWGDYDRGRNCYYVRRRTVERNGDVVIRRSRVCED